MIFLAKILSFFFNPVVFILLMPYFIVYKQTFSGWYALKWEIFSSFFIILGLIAVVAGRWKRIFSDFDLSKKEERSKFYLISWFLAFSYLFAAIFFKGIFFPLSIMAFGTALGIVIFTIVNYYIKASIHVAVACAFVITISLLQKGNWFWFTFWIVPLVAWARLELKKHTWPEIIIGGVLGTAVTLLTFLVGKYLSAA